MFRPLNKADITNIIEYEIAKLNKRLLQQGYVLALDPESKEFLIDRGYNPEFGARPLRRAIGQYVEDPLSESLLSGGFEAPCTIQVTRKKDAEGKDEDHLFFTSAPAPENFGWAKPEAPQPKKQSTTQST